MDVLTHKQHTKLQVVEKGGHREHWHEQVGSVKCLPHVWYGGCGPALASCSSRSRVFSASNSRNSSARCAALCSADGWSSAWNGAILCRTRALMCQCVCTEAAAGWFETVLTGDNLQSSDFGPTGTLRANFLFNSIIYQFETHSGNLSTLIVTYRVCCASIGCQKPGAH